MAGNLKVITTRDGSSTIYNHELNETYHSMNGAITESQHVFMKEGLDHCYQTKASGTEIKVFEVGFGTGLNAFLSIEWAGLNHMLVYYESIEAYPLDAKMISGLNYFIKDEVNRQVLESLHSCSWNERISLTDHFTIKKVEGKLGHFSPVQEYFDIVFYDAFAPSKQPEMWDFQIISKVIDALIVGGIFVTYCAKGQLKRDLKAMGCEVETLPGPPGKMEMVRATKIHTLWPG